MESLIGDTCKLLFFCFLCSSSFFSIGSLTKDYFSAEFLGLHAECESVKQKGPSSQDQALDSANSARLKEGTKETATTCTAVTNDVAQTDVYIPTSDEMFRFIVMRRLRMMPPSSVQEFEDLIEFMSTVKGIITQKRAIQEIKETMVRPEHRDCFERIFIIITKCFL